ncbi:MAG: hypothetical protein HFJ84_00110 [Clostridiales bacterium]|jgi:membrane associated rhomboid family serine protease|nr:hypothetical protein [Clostridiales bacterium]
MKTIQLALIFFFAGLGLAVLSMVLGPFGWSNASIASAAIAGVLGLAALILVLRDWKNPTEKSE